MKQIELVAIAVDASTQTRASISEPVVADYADRMLDGAQFPAVVLFHDGNAYYIGDGFHRVLASKRNGAVTVPADVRPGTREDALWFALGANREHGHQMTSADKKHAILIAIDTWPERSNREIAGQIGCSDVYISQVKKQVRSTLHLSQNVTGKDGKTYPARRRPEREAPLSGPLDRSPAAVAKRVEQMKSLAESGHSSRQIAAAVGMSEEGCRAKLREQGVDVPADKAIGQVLRHDSNRIVEHMVMDAENLTADVNLIEWQKLDHDRLGEWINGLVQSRNSLNAFIKRLIKEKEKHVKAA